MQAYTVHRDSDIFGTDCEAWRPERWLSENTPADQLKAMQKALLPFSQGEENGIPWSKSIPH